ncbi:small membrane A-kinase anchor protein [Ornithorhynchus anatinus]|uniref:small membrane A-kinase anchor protein n=1 Tax=Ornithorhynchus anatinus TaxID=9258 RepID=UPI0010A8D2F5|nr:small membrane A-kinase anchor protein [Ornithorhynchus anatinus]XP_028924996.1 small membrane A-kinase anchor protein [Ornithorhynchus anatinus]
MGCIKSKHPFPLPDSLPGERRDSDESLVRDGLVRDGLVRDSPSDTSFLPAARTASASAASAAAAAPAASGSASSVVLLHFAHRLSQEILDEAVKQWAAADGKYGDIPYIESDLP